MSEQIEQRWWEPVKDELSDDDRALLRHYDEYRRAERPEIEKLRELVAKMRAESVKCESHEPFYNGELQDRATEWASELESLLPAPPEG